MTNLNLRPRQAQITLPLNYTQAHRQTLERLYARKAAVEALIASLEAYARSHASAPIAVMPSRGN